MSANFSLDRLPGLAAQARVPAAATVAVVALVVAVATAAEATVAVDLVAVAPLEAGTSSETPLCLLCINLETSSVAGVFCHLTENAPPMFVGTYLGGKHVAPPPFPCTCSLFWEEFVPSLTFCEISRFFRSMWISSASICSPC